MSEREEAMDENNEAEMKDVEEDSDFEDDDESIYDEEEVNDEEGEEEEDDNDGEEESSGPAQTYLPGKPLEEGEELVCDENAYVMLHQANTGDFINITKRMNHKRYFSIQEHLA